jgi:hypothetical protein
MKIRYPFLAAIIVFAALSSASSHACDVSTDFKVIGWNSKNHTVLAKVTEDVMDDTDKGAVWNPSFAEFFVFNLTTGKTESKTRVRGKAVAKAAEKQETKLMKGFEKPSFTFLAGKGSSYAWSEKKGEVLVKVERPTEDDITGAYSVYWKSGGKETLVAPKVLETTMAATEMTRPVFAFVAGDSVVVGFSGCGSGSLWAAPVSKF